MQQLDDLAGLVIERVNDLHVQGQAGGTSGLPFFTGDGAANIDIATAIADNFNLIATSRSGLPGDNDLALEIAALAHQPLAGPGGTMLLTDNYRALLTDLATQRQRYEFFVESQDNVVVAVEARLASVRGVSLDEEGANMVRYQNAYDAAARVVTTVQEMFDTLLKMV
jgi:flagellar hook-associated protein 1 FlgK